MFVINQTKPDERGKKPRRGNFSRALTGLRYYNPRLGRWMNRDPIGEVGGRNVYSFCRNKSACLWDVLGLYPTPDLTDAQREAVNKAVEKLGLTPEKFALLPISLVVDTDRNIVGQADALTGILTLGSLFFGGSGGANSAIERAAALLHELAHIHKWNENDAWLLLNCFLQSKLDPLDDNIWFGDSRYKPKDWGSGTQCHCEEDKFKNWEELLK